MPAATTTKPKRGTKRTPGEEIVDQFADAIDRDLQPAPIPRETPDVPAAIAALLRVPLGLVDIGENVRKSIDQASIEELAASLESEGLLQPIGVESDGDRYALVYGQRRVLAARHLGWTSIAANLVAPRDRDIAQILENVQREDLNAIDLGQALKRLEDRGLTQADIARRMGRSGPYVSNAIRLLGADPKVQQAVVSGELSATHARALLGLPAADQRSIAARVVVDHISSHQLEQEIKWKRDAADREEHKQRKTTKWIPKAIAALRAAGIAQDAGVEISGSYYDVDIGKVRTAVRTAGWKIVDDYGSRAADTGCECTSVRLSVGGRASQIERTCHVVKHRDQKVNTDHLERAAADERRQQLLFEAGELVRPFLELLPLPILRLYAMVAKQSIGYHSPWDQWKAADRDVATAEALGVLSAWQLRGDSLEEVLGQLRGDEVAPTDEELERLGVGIFVQEAVERGEAEDDEVLES